MLTHIDSKNRPAMVNVGDKPATRRTAHAAAVVALPRELAALLRDGDIPTAKGPVFHTAILAGVMGAKRTSDLIPLCHPLLITKVTVDLTPDENLPGIHVRALVKVSGQTGVEMEALTAVSVACLTIYDMVKAADRAMQIEGIRLLEKMGGKSGHWTADHA